MDDATRTLKKAEAKETSDRLKAERAAKAAQRREKAETERAKRVAEQQALAEDNHRKYGERVERIRFDGKELLFYGRGYLQVVGWSSSVPFEKILHVTVKHTVINKSPGGRKATAAGLLMMGLPPVNMLASGERIDWTVTIRTSEKTHQFKETGRYEGDKALQIETIANSLIASASALASESEGHSAGSGSGVLDQVAKLRELFEAGTLTEEEYSAKKTLLLDRL